MPAIERVIPLVGHLPASIRDALVRRLRELIGLGLIALAGVAAAALMTWSVQDPSLSHATSRAIRNILCYGGAIGADLLMQILGLGAIMAPGHTQFAPFHLSAGTCVLLCFVSDKHGVPHVMDGMIKSFEVPIGR